jgi:hypothetical protein
MVGFMHMSRKPNIAGGKGARDILPERPARCCAQHVPGPSFAARRSLLAAGLLALSVTWAFAQFQMNMQRSAPPVSSGSIRYAPGYQVRPLPSEERFAAQNAGLLPSENRNLSFLSGNLPSQGRFTYLTQSSVRYGSSAAAGSLNGSVRYQRSAPAYALGSSWSLAAPARPYQPTAWGGLTRSGSLTGGSSLIRPTTGSVGGSLRYSGIR